MAGKRADNSNDDATATTGENETSALAAAEGWVVVRGLTKRYQTFDATITAADNIDLDIPAGSITSLTGPSGSGKSTLLHLIGALDRPDAGTITVSGREITRMSRRALPDYRRTVGFVFQRFNLLPTLTVLDNVMAPVLPFKVDYDAKDRARELLAAVGLAGREHTLATRMSGGQQQRVAIARALMNRPPLVLADEPTGNLDTATGAEIIELLFALRDQDGTTLLIATHDVAVANRCDNAIHIRDGRVSEPANVLMPSDRPNGTDLPGAPT